MPESGGDEARPSRPRLGVKVEDECSVERKKLGLILLCFGVRYASIDSLQNYGLLVTCWSY